MILILLSKHQLVYWLQSALILYYEDFRLLTCAGAHEDAQHGLDESRGHIMDILEESDQALVQHCYWDFGRWSDLWRVWRPVGDDRPFKETPVSLAVSCLCHAAE